MGLGLSLGPTCDDDFRRTATGWFGFQPSDPCSLTALSLDCTPFACCCSPAKTGRAVDGLSGAAGTGLVFDGLYERVSSGFVYSTCDEFNFGLNSQSTSSAALDCGLLARLTWDATVHGVEDVAVLVSR